MQSTHKIDNQSISPLIGSATEVNKFALQGQTLPLHKSLEDSRDPATSPLFSASFSEELSKSYAAMNPSNLTKGLDVSAELADEAALPNMLLHSSPAETIPITDNFTSELTMVSVDGLSIKSLPELDAAQPWASQTSQPSSLIDKVDSHKIDAIIGEEYNEANDLLTYGENSISPAAQPSSLPIGVLPDDGSALADDLSTPSAITVDSSIASQTLDEATTDLTTSLSELDDLTIQGVNSLAMNFTEGMDARDMDSVAKDVAMASLQTATPSIGQSSEQNTALQHNVAVNPQTDSLNQVSAPTAMQQTALNPTADKAVSPTIGAAGNQGSLQTSWGAQSAESSQAANTGSQTGNSSANTGGQSSNSPQQQLMQQQEIKAQALNQQAALRASDEQILKSESKETLLTTTETAPLGERRSALPLGLQSINVPVKSPQWGQALAHRVSFMANNQIQQAQITLNPEKLGPIQIRLQIDREQQVQVSMLATQGTTREALETAMPRLKEMLEQSGMNLVSVDISDERQFSEQQNEQADNKMVGAAGTSSSEIVAEESETVQTRVSDNIVDFYA